MGDAREEWYLGRTVLLHRADVSPWAFASETFQQRPRPVTIGRVREDHAGLFGLLALLEDPQERAAAFLEHALRVAWLHAEPRYWPSTEDRRRHGLPGLLHDWVEDAQGPAGMVVREWAEGRFGLRVLSPPDDEAAAAARLLAHRHGVAEQLDLLYTFAQDELVRRHPGERWLTLATGGGGPGLVEVRDPTGTLLELDAVCRLTAETAFARRFGPPLRMLRVPVPKVLCFPGLIPDLGFHTGHLVLGGDYRVTASLATPQP